MELFIRLGSPKLINSHLFAESGLYFHFLCAFDKNNSYNLSKNITDISNLQQSSRIKHIIVPEEAFENYFKTKSSRYSNYANHISAYVISLATLESRNLSEHS